MFGFFKNLFGGGSEKLSEAIKNGAVLIDVRTQGEFASGNVKGSVNIPLDRLSGQLGKLKKDKTIVVFCASGMRSASAKSILNRNGFENVINGGSWKNVEKFIS
ncbi:MAG: rhodanese-like domain-containing protein [Flavobacteriaceae bacterium]